MPQLSVSLVALLALGSCSSALAPPSYEPPGIPSQVDLGSQTATSKKCAGAKPTPPTSGKQPERVDEKPSINTYPSQPTSSVNSASPTKKPCAKKPPAEDGPAPGSSGEKGVAESSAPVASKDPAPSPAPDKSNAPSRPSDAMPAAGTGKPGSEREAKQSVPCKKTSNEAMPSEEPEKKGYPPTDSAVGEMAVNKGEGYPTKGKPETTDKGYPPTDKTGKADPTKGNPEVLRVTPAQKRPETGSGPANPSKDPAPPGGTLLPDGMCACPCSAAGPGYSR